MKTLTTMAGVAALLCLTALSAKATLLTNWARLGVATQSSTYPGGDASKAIDGNTSGWWTEGSVSHSNDTDPWWHVDLLETRPIGHLHIWFRDDCCQVRNDNLRIVIYSSADTNGVVLWETNTSGFFGVVPREFGVDLVPAINGRSIHVEHTADQTTERIVMLAEVEAFNQPLTSVANYARDNMGAIPTSSSCYNVDCALYGPWQAIDGNLHGDTSISGWPYAYSAPDNTAGVDPLPWWQVDLQAPETVGSVVLWPRRDRTFARYDNVRLFVADQNSNTLYQQVFAIQPSGMKFVVNFVPALANAKIVRVETTDATPDKFLNLPEVQVLAPLASAPTLTFTTNLQPITVAENHVPTFGPVAVTVDGGIRPEDVSYRWFRNGVEIPNMAGSWLASYSTPTRVGPANNGDKYKVQASVSGYGVFSSEVELTVNADTNPPVLLYADGNRAFNRVRVWFSEPVDPATSQVAANYQLSGGLTIASATMVAPSGSAGDNLVDLVTSAQTPGQTYTLTVSGVKDQSAAGHTVAAGSTVQFTAWTLTTGHLLFEHYDNLGGAADSDIVTALADPRVVAGTPTTLGYVAGRFDTRTIFPDDSHENFLGRISGWITPTESGDYDFFLRSDDASRLYLSANATPPNPDIDTPICIETDCCDPFSEPNVGDPATTAAPISLVAGTRYAVLALYKEAGGGDYCMVAWRKTTDTTPAATLPYLPGQYLSTYVDPNTDIVFTRQPTDQVGVVASTGVEIFTRDFNANDGGFTVTNSGDLPAGWGEPWAYKSASGSWSADGSSGDCGGPFNSQLSSPTITLTQDGLVSLEFDHRYAFESGLWDCGQVRISVNGGDFTLVPAENFTANGYAEGAIIGNGIALNQRGFNGNSLGYAQNQFITSKATLGTFSKNDTIMVQFVGAWDDCSNNGSYPGWQIDSLKLNLLPMTIQSFASTNGGFTVVSDPATPPGAWGAWTYVATNGAWSANGADANCGGPFNSKLTSPAYTVPQSDEVTLTFTHRYSFEGGLWDGGQVRISVNGGAFTPVSPDNFTANGYAAENIIGTGVLNGQRGFNGDSAGYSTGFITSSVVLGTFSQNDTIAVQFVGAWDECSGGTYTPSWQIQSLQLTYGKAAKAATFTAEVSTSQQGTPVTPIYQWQRDDGAGWVDIPSANSASFTIYPTAADMAATYRLMVSVPAKSDTSSVVKLIAGVVEPPTLSISTSGAGVSITFTGKLQSSASVTGPYQDVAGATSPHVVAAPAGMMFFRSVK